MKRKIAPAIFTVFLYLLFLSFIISRVSDVLDFSVLVDYREQILKSAGITILFSFGALICSLVTGFGIFLAAGSRNPYLSLPAAFYKEIIMGTPLLVLVFVVVYIIGAAFGIRDRMLLGMVSLTMYMSPYMSNVFMGAFETIGKEQFVVMDFYRFTLLQRYRYIILPQMIRPVLPGLINNLSGIIKGTSILSVIAVSEIFYTITVMSNRTYRYVEGYFMLWLVYLLITIPLSLLAKFAAAGFKGKSGGLK